MTDFYIFFRIAKVINFYKRFDIFNFSKKYFIILRAKVFDNNNIADFSFFIL